MLDYLFSGLESICSSFDEGKEPTRLSKMIGQVYCEYNLTVNNGY
jgi:hypothetical protein